MTLKSIAAGALIVCALPVAALAQAYEPGDWVLSHYQGGPELYPATVQSVSGTRVTLLWDDQTISVVNTSDLRPYTWRVGTNVSCRWTDGRWYPARIARMGADGLTLDIVYTEDNTSERTNTGRCRSGG